MIELKQFVLQSYAHIFIFIVCPVIAVGGTIIGLIIRIQTKKIMTDLFGEEKVRSIGLYQPYASLMIHGKVESRWVKTGKKPPFPLGKYLVYSTQKAYSKESFAHISGEFLEDANKVLKDDKTSQLNGYGLCIGELVKVEKMYPMLMPMAFVGLDRLALEIDHDAPDNDIQIDGHTLWALHFANMKPITPFSFKGKQGVGVLSNKQKSLIHIL